LLLLKDTIGLTFDEPTSFPATDVLTPSEEFTDYLSGHGAELCALRLIPQVAELPKLRMRGKSVADAAIWLAARDIDPTKYRADFLPHDDNSIWATIFIVNNSGIFGEITHGLHSDLTQGQYANHLPNQFRYDFKTWQLERPDEAALSHLKVLTGMIKVDEPGTRQRLESELDARFSHNFLQGYFETTYSDEFGIWFKDYNRILGRMYQDARAANAKPSGHHLVAGQASSPGRATGRVRLIDGIQGSSMEPGEILVCRMTTPEHIQLMQQSAAIVTDLGGILSHAAIVARELGKPCLTATGNATSVLTDGMLVEVDADAGVVRAA
jgi:phosphohistidine swiveling domain-containing protein